MSEWQQQILEGIGHLPSVGVPGAIRISNSKVEQILTGEGGDSEVVIAAGLLGQGRVIVIAHDGYLVDIKHGSQNKSIARLHSNMNKWFAGSQSATNAYDLDFVVIGDSYQPSQLGARYNGIIVWHGGKINMAEKELDKFISYICDGGAFLHAMCPWGWLQLNPGKRLQDMPFYKVLDKLGAFYTTDHVDCQEKGFNISACSTGRHFDAKLHDLSTVRCVASHFARKSGSWMTQILSGISAVPCIGMPGSIVVYGEHAEPILCGEDHSVIIAAAEQGQHHGRVVVISHNGYAKDFEKEHGNKDQTIKTLHDNLKKWLSPQSQTVTVINKQFDIANLKRNKGILVWRGDDTNLSEDDVNSVLRNIFSGGSFVHAVCPWGWLQTHSEKSLEELPFHQLLDSIGVCYTTEYAKANANKFYVTKEVELIHVGHILTQVATGESNILNTHGNVAAQIRFIPTKERQSLDVKCGNILHKCAGDIMHKGCPSKHNPVKDTKSKAVLALYESLSDAYEMKAKAPGVEGFPGDFQLAPPVHCINIKIESRIKNVHTTGYYLPAGTELKATIIKQTGSMEKWTIQVGAHSDDLSKHSELRRWPIVIRKAIMRQDVTSLFSQYGGLVYLFSPDKPSTLNLHIEGIVEAPHFNITDPHSASNWTTKRNAPGIWADLCGEFIIFTIPSSSIRSLEDPSDVLQTWDRVVKAHHHLRGSDIHCNHRQWVVADEQTSAGYMHSGYPIVTHLDITLPPPHNECDNFIFDKQKLVTNGQWGLFHEIGHNMQRSTWTFEGTVEVTCNIFTLHAMEIITKTKPLDTEWVQKQSNNVQKYLDQNAPFTIWKESPGVALMIYAQVGHYLGWDCYIDVFSQYESLPKTQNPKTNQEQIDQWFMRLSLAAAHNLAPMLEFWGVPFSNSCKKQIEHLPAFLPKDKLTELAPQRFEEISNKYPGIVHQVDVFPRYSPDL